MPRRTSTSDEWDASRKQADYAERRRAWTEKVGASIREMHDAAGRASDEQAPAKPNSNPITESST